MSFNVAFHKRKATCLANYERIKRARFGDDLPPPRRSVYDMSSIWVLQSEASNIRNHQSDAHAIRIGHGVPHWYDVSESQSSDTRGQYVEGFRDGLDAVDAASWPNQFRESLGI